MAGVFQIVNSIEGPLFFVSLLLFSFASIQKKMVRKKQEGIKYILS